jgi:hypothetical protein
MDFKSTLLLLMAMLALGVEPGVARQPEQPAPKGKARWDAFVSACKSDAEKHCKAIPAGSGRVLSCLKGREADLAPDCKAQFSRANSDPVVTR